MKFNNYAAFLATKISLIFVATLTIFAELSPLCMAFLKKIMYHHWVAKSVLSILVWFLSYYLFLNQQKEIKIQSFFQVLNLSILAIVVFYIVFALYV